MTKFDQLLESIDAAPSGPSVGAFFDFDGTLIGGYSVFPFLREQYKSGRLSGAELAELLGATAKFGSGQLDFASLLKLSAEIMKGQSVKDYNRFGEEVYEKRIARMIYPEARRLVKAHREKGHTVAVVSTRSTAYSTRNSSKTMPPSELARWLRLKPVAMR